MPAPSEATYLSPHAPTHLAPLSQSLAPPSKPRAPRTLDLRALGPDYTSSPGLTAFSSAGDRDSEGASLLSGSGSGGSSAQTVFSPPTEEEIRACLWGSHDTKGPAMIATEDEGVEDGEDAARARTEKAAKAGMTIWPFLQRATKGLDAPRARLSLLARSPAYDYAPLSARAPSPALECLIPHSLPGRPALECPLPRRPALECAIPVSLPGRPALVARASSSSPSPLELPSPFPTPEMQPSCAMLPLLRPSLGADEVVREVGRVLGAFELGDAEEEEAEEEADGGELGRAGGSAMRDF